MKIHLLVLVIIAQLVDLSLQKEHCILQQPLDLDYPIKTKNFNPEFKFWKVKNPIIQKIEDDHFRIIDKLGIGVDNGVTYDFSQIDIFSPSLHRLGGEIMDMEMQIKGLDESLTSSYTLVFLFEKASIPFIHLFKMGIGRNIVSKLPTKREDPRNSFITLHSSFNLNPFIDENVKYLQYTGDDVTAKNHDLGAKKCTTTTYTVMFEKLWISHEQLLEFTKGKDRKWGETTRNDQQHLFANFEAQRTTEEKGKDKHHDEGTDDLIKILL